MIQHTIMIVVCKKMQTTFLYSQLYSVFLIEAYSTNFYLFFLFNLRNQASGMVNMGWEMNDINKWNVILLQFQVDYSSECIINTTNLDQLMDQFGPLV